MKTKDDPPNERAVIHEQFTYEFGTLERLISKDITCFIDLNNPLDHILISDFKEEVNEEIELIKNSFINAVFSFEEERYLERYIQFHQCALIRLAGNLLRHVEPETLGHVSTSVNKDVFSQYIYHSLQELLDFIEKHFSKYFDQNAWIPKNYKRIVLHDIRSNLDALKEILHLQQVNAHLINIALLPLTEFAKEDTTNEITYRRAMYLKELKKQLFLINSNYDTVDTNETITLLLYYLNFNSPEFYNHCIHKLKGICETAETLSECIEKLALFQKSVKQTQVKPGFILDPSVPSLKKQLSHWIDEEISFHERKQHLEKDIEQPDAAEIDYKVKIDLSVAQLAYFLKVLIEIKVIQNENVAKLLRFFSKIIKTNRAEIISPDNFRNRYYKAESGTRDAVKKLLTRMLAFVNSDQGTL